jgi:hypothetical protein
MRQRGQEHEVRGCRVGNRVCTPDPILLTLLVGETCQSHATRPVSACGNRHAPNTDVCYPNPLRRQAHPVGPSNRRMLVPAIHSRRFSQRFIYFSCRAGVNAIIAGFKSACGLLVPTRVRSSRSMGGSNSRVRPLQARGTEPPAHFPYCTFDALTRRPQSSQTRNKQQSQRALNSSASSMLRVVLHSDTIFRCHHRQWHCTCAQQGRSDGYSQ